MAEPTVRVSGFVLSSLMFQHVNSDSDAEGLILGENKSEEQITISDSQADHIHIEETHYIQKHISCNKLHSFYNSVGDVNVEALKTILVDDKQEHVIGWYRQRRNTDQRMTFREKIVHENLKTSLSNPHMVFVLLTPSKLTSPGSTHRTEYAAFISRSRQFLNIPVLVTNLGLLEQLAYWKGSAPCSAAGYKVTMKKHGSRFFSPSGALRDVTDVNKMNDSLQSELQKVCSDVEESERLVEALQADVSSLRTRLVEKRQRGTTEKVEDAPEQKNNLLLHDAIKALFFSSPLFHTQTLTLDALPVPEVCCNSESGQHASLTTLTQSDAPNPRPRGRRRQRETASVGRERKRSNNELDNS